ncbi:MAG: hypothetical protein F4X02_02900 [Chloroflexi bacterium]|nr:hypothetical protein [Chloroflexota bacterium]
MFAAASGLIPDAASPSQSLSLRPFQVSYYLQEKRQTGTDLMPTYIYRIQPVRPAMLAEGPTEEEARVTAEHFAYLKQLMADGSLILAGRTLNSDYSAFGIAIFEARDDEHMRQITAADPGVAKKLFRAEWHRYRIALHAPGNYNEG